VCMPLAHMGMSACSVSLHGVHACVLTISV
jgi:hypothetical protein